MMTSLFLDRDGVINIRMPGDYVKTPAEFIPTPGLDEALRLLAPLFGRIVVVTNQAGIGRGLMSEADLAQVHAYLMELVENAGGRIDGIYYCPHRSDAGCDCRKPAIGMGLQAQADFPDIDFQQAWLVGDSASDIGFAHKLGIKTALIAGKAEESEKLAALEVDGRFESLLDFAQWISSRLTHEQTTE